MPNANDNFGVTLTRPGYAKRIPLTRREVLSRRIDATLNVSIREVADIHAKNIMEQGFCTGEPIL